MSLPHRLSSGSTTLPAFDRGSAASHQAAALASSSSTPRVSGDQAWPSQYNHAGQFSQHSPVGLSTVPETQQQSAPLQQQQHQQSQQLQQQAMLRATSLQPPRLPQHSTGLQTASSTQAPGTSNLKQRMTRNQPGADTQQPSERVKWAEKQVSSGHF